MKSADEIRAEASTSLRPMTLGTGTAGGPVVEVVEVVDVVAVRFRRRGGRGRRERRLDTRRLTPPACR